MIRVSLSQFLDYTAKISQSAKIKAVRKIKSNPDYHPATDYWKRLRDKIKEIHEKDLPIESLKEILNEISEKKLQNYSRAINTYISFVRKNEIEYFAVGKASWATSEELFIGSNPELGLVINGKKYYVKIYYKKPNKDTKVTKRNINSTLTLMQLAEKDFETDPEATFAVLNLQNGKLIPATMIKPEDELELELEADNFVNIWNRI